MLDGATPDANRWETARVATSVLTLMRKLLESKSLSLKILDESSSFVFSQWEKRIAVEQMSLISHANSNFDAIKFDTIKLSLIPRVPQANRFTCVIHDWHISGVSEQEDESTPDCDVTDMSQRLIRHKPTLEREGGKQWTSSSSFSWAQLRWCRISRTHIRDVYSAFFLTRRGIDETSFLLQIIHSIWI